MTVITLRLGRLGLAAYLHMGRNTHIFMSEPVSMENNNSVLYCQLCIRAGKQRIGQCNSGEIQIHPGFADPLAAPLNIFPPGQS